MLYIKKNPNGDTRTCDVSKVSKQELMASSIQHIDDVRRALGLFADMLNQAGSVHDMDKIVDIEGFYRDFKVSFATTDWWDNHRHITRHHLAQSDGIPNNVNLLDILEYIADCVMAGLSRTGEVYPLTITPELLTTAFQNTVEFLKTITVIQPPSLLEHMMANGPFNKKEETVQ